MAKAVRAAVGNGLQELTSGSLALEKIEALPRNAKQHDLDGLDQSLERFGFLQRAVINRTTGHLLSGHGRVAALRRRKDAGGAPPGNIAVQGSGARAKWLVPVDYVELPETEEDAAAIALNRLQERGGWDQTALAALLLEQRDAGTLTGTGFTDEDLSALLAVVAPRVEPTAPEQFGEFGEDLPTEHRCPKCGYEWSGKPA